jgi:hypothetical protein
MKKLEHVVKLAADAASRLGTGPAARTIKSMKKRGVIAGAIRQFTHPYRKDHKSSGRRQVADRAFSRGGDSYRAIPEGIIGAPNYRTHGNILHFSAAPSRGAYSNGLRISGRIRSGWLYTDATGKRLQYVDPLANVVGSGADYYPIVIDVDPSGQNSLSGAPVGLFCGSPIIYQMSTYFSRFRFDSLGFEYRPMCSTTTAGTVALAWSTDPDLKQANMVGSLMLDFNGAQGCSVHQSMGIKTDNRMRGELYYSSDLALANTGDAATNLTINTLAERSTHCGSLIVGLIDLSSLSTNIGAVWTTFVLDLYEPRPTGALSLPNFDSLPSVRDRHGQVWKRSEKEKDADKTSVGESRVTPSSVMRQDASAAAACSNTRQPSTPVVVRRESTLRSAVHDGYVPV